MPNYEDSAGQSASNLKLPSIVGGSVQKLIGLDSSRLFRHPPSQSLDLTLHEPTNEGRVWPSATSPMFNKSTNFTSPFKGSGPGASLDHAQYASARCSPLSQHRVTIESFRSKFNNSEMPKQAFGAELRNGPKEYTHQSTQRRLVIR